MTQTFTEQDADKYAGLLDMGTAVADVLMGHDFLLTIEALRIVGMRLLIATGADPFNAPPGTVAATEAEAAPLMHLDDAQAVRALLARLNVSVFGFADMAAAGAARH